MENGRPGRTSIDEPLQQKMRPPLHTNVLLDNEDEVRKLLALGANVEEVDFSGCTAIQLAAASGFLNITKLLLANGALPEARDLSHGNTSLHEASWRGYSALVQLLAQPSTIDLQNNSGFSALHLACQAGHNQSTRELLLAGSNPNIVNTYGDTCLHTSVRYGHAGVTRILLSARTLPDIQNKNGDSSLHIACAMGRKKLAKILLSSACNPNLQNHQHETPLDISLRKGFADVTHVLQNPPTVLTPLQRDEMRVSKYKPAAGLSATAHIRGREHQAGRRAGRRRKGVFESTVEVHQVDSVPSPRNGEEVQVQSLSQSESKPSSSRSRSAAERGKICSHLSSRSPTTTDTQSNTKREGGSQRQAVVEEVPKWSPYGCHHPTPYNPSPAFPTPNIDSLPREPLTTGELYYLDLAGNIHKGPMGVSEGCYCGTLLSQSQSSQSMMALNKPTNQSKRPKGEAKGTVAESGHLKYEDQLQSLTNQLCRIHMDTQTQLSSLHSILNERLKDPVDDRHEPPNETQLMEWVRHYRRFRKGYQSQHFRIIPEYIELTKNPKSLSQAKELLASVSALLSNRLVSSAQPDSDTDSGI